MLRKYTETYTVFCVTSKESCNAPYFRKVIQSDMSFVKKKAAYNCIERTKNRNNAIISFCGI